MTVRQGKQRGAGMEGGIRHQAERVALVVVATIGIVAVPADLLGWLDKLAPDGTIPGITLIILSTITLSLFLELDRLKELDTIKAQLAKIDIDIIADELRQDHYGGVTQVHRRFPENEFARFLGGVNRQVTILQTWIPDLEEFDAELRKALVERRAELRFLLLHPSSPVARLRDEALRSLRDPAREENVRASVERCLSILGDLYHGIGEDDRGRLRVRVYNSLPSVAVYKVDECYLVSWFLHGRLAINSAQLEVHGSDTAMGEKVQQELDTLWRIGRDVDLRDWRVSISNISL
ncbi:hypothetical protein V1L54_14040 [Streptomyces sp. TRM 70361]|uniref:hypothetical protein n=1 Tax=Streptomyces sp. TRM 70361 TaxID=3116553 RepID=UPI002E7BAF83|nr:hypothetical protein [Streptomyces sp. TRM 70361]MEE1940512.1 hypothetical protein [Streptomyces sp. TRM 70361]